MRNIMMCAALAAFGLVSLNLSGCTATARRPATSNPQLALELNEKASKVRSDDPREALKLLRRAVEADPYCGPALNNLGVLYLQEGRRDRAVNALEQAQRNMPQDPRPYVNLAQVFAHAHQYREALDFCKQALELRPDYLPAVQLKAWLQIRTERTDETTLAALERIALRSRDPDWRRFGEEYAMKLRGEIDAAERNRIGD